MNETPKTNHGCRIVRRLLVVLAILATLIAIFYTEEDWRGKRAWENCKHELEAQGVVLDWNRFIPPPVPDDQNFYSANTNILLKFSQILRDDDHDAQLVRHLKWLNLQITPSNSFPILDTSKSGPIIVAKIIISPRSAGLESTSNTLAVAFNDSAAPKRIQQLIHATVGATIYGAQGFEFSRFQLANLAPARIVMQAEAPPLLTDLAALIPSDTIGQDGRLKLAATADPRIFQVQLANFRITAAADYLSWSDQFTPAFNEIREALKRPYAILPGDYSQPFQSPIPNFVTLRALAQTLAQRVQCDFLLGEPDHALQELTLIHNVCRILEKPPTGQPVLLIDAMIDVAINGLYGDIVAEGLQRHAWQGPQLEALQAQLEQVALLPIVKRAFACELAASTRTLETVSLPKLESIIMPRQPRWARIAYAKYYLLPYGWIYQNMATDAKLMSSQTEGFDSPENVVQPEKFTDISREFKSIPWRYKFIAAEAIPNFTKAWQTSAYNQTLVNEAQIACALERYRLAHIGYPETLDALTPQFIETVPHDLIGGQPLHYRRTSDGKFSLYSVGWNETDDGGQVSRPGNSGHGADYSKGDWAWPPVTE